MVDKYPQTKVRVPQHCMSCGAGYTGGHQIPEQHMTLGLRIFYRCGASLSVAEDLGDGCYMLRFKNCSGLEKSDGA